MTQKKTLTPAQAQLSVQILNAINASGYLYGDQLVKARAAIEQMLLVPAHCNVLSQLHILVTRAQADAAHLRTTNTQLNQQITRHHKADAARDLRDTETADLVAVLTAGVAALAKKVRPISRGY